MAVAEAWAETPQRLARYVGPDELHQAFNFDFLDATWSADSFHKVIDTALAESAVVHYNQSFLTWPHPADLGGIFSFWPSPPSGATEETHGGTLDDR